MSERERNITVKLNDEECRRLIEKCGEHGLTVGKLVENFICDLVGGSLSNGSDERMHAEQWFDRCWFGMFPEDTLLRHLLYEGFDPEDYINALDGIKEGENDLQDAQEHPENYDKEDLEYLQSDIEEWKDELARMKADWHPDQEPDMDEQLQIIKKWIEEKRKLQGVDTP